MFPINSYYSVSVYSIVVPDKLELIETTSNSFVYSETYECNIPAVSRHNNTDFVDGL